MHEEKSGYVENEKELHQRWCFVSRIRSIVSTSAGKEFGFQLMAQYSYMVTSQIERAGKEFSLMVRHDEVMPFNMQQSEMTIY